MTVSYLALRPRDGLTVKDPRGFNLAGGMHARSTAWPLPPTVSGAVRTAIGFAQGYSSHPDANGRERWQNLLSSVAIKGPFTLHRRELEAPWSILWPAPQDAAAFSGRRQGDIDLEWLAPVPAMGALATWSGEANERAATEALWRAELTDPRKPIETPPWWCASDFLPWLTFPGKTRLREEAPQPLRRFDLHVRLKPTTSTPDESMLFGYETHEYLLAAGNRGKRALRLDEIAIGLRIECADDLSPPCGLWRVGGESRVVWAESIDDVDALSFPRSHFERQGRWKPSARFRAVLCTPGCFDAGWRPDWLQPHKDHGNWVFRGRIPSTDLDVLLKAAIVTRPLMTSGWDFARREAKPSRRLVAPGAVYFFELADPDRRLSLDDLAGLWLLSVQLPHEQARRDGFGLVVPGEWPSQGPQ